MDSDFPPLFQFHGPTSLFKTLAVFARLRSIGIGIAWRHRLDECRLEGGGKAGLADRIEDCMEEPEPTCVYCKQRRSCFKSPPSPLHPSPSRGGRGGVGRSGYCARSARDAAGSICDCFYEGRRGLMDSLKAAAQKVRSILGWAPFHWRR